MDTHNTLNSIPIDLFNEIFSRLPIKTIGRCRCVSKIFESRLGSEDFKQLFLTRSLTRPRLLFVADKVFDWVFYSSPQPQNPYERSSLVVTTEFPKFPRSRVSAFICKLIYAFGLFYFPCKSTTWHDVICNPSTGHYVILPKLEASINYVGNFLGFDPIEKQFKVLVTNARRDNEWIHYILTLGSGKMRWRTIKCPSLHDYPCISSNGICINGVLYYLAEDIGVMSSKSCVMVCFDIRTETFKFIVIDVQSGGRRQLINYKGKLGVTILRDNGVDVELYMLVLEEEEEWSKYFYTLPTINLGTCLSVVGMSSRDEIVLSTIYYKPFYLYYFNLENNSLQKVQVRGLEKHGNVHVSVIMDHVEDLYVNDAKFFKSNIHAKPREAPGPSKRQSRRHLRFESINTFDALSLSDEEDGDAA